MAWSCWDRRGCAVLCFRVAVCIAVGIAATVRVEAATGKLKVTIKPAEAAESGAAWRIDNGSWHDSGDVVRNLAEGQYDVSFKRIDGWKKPRTIQVEIQSGETTKVSARYKPALKADFDVGIACGSSPLAVEFTDRSAPSADVVAWEWHFGDGGSSNEQHPEHVYTDDGTYSVSLRVTDARGKSDEVLKTDLIAVGESVWSPAQASQVIEDRLIADEFGYEPAGPSEDGSGNVHWLVLQIDEAAGVRTFTLQDLLDNGTIATVATATYNTATDDGSELLPLGMCGSADGKVYAYYLKTTYSDSISEKVLWRVYDVVSGWSSATVDAALSNHAEAHGPETLVGPAVDGNGVVHWLAIEETQAGGTVSQTIRDVRSNGASAVVATAQYTTAGPGRHTGDAIEPVGLAASPTGPVYAYFLKGIYTGGATISSIQVHRSEFLPGSGWAIPQEVSALSAELNPTSFFWPFTGPAIDANGDAHWTRYAFWSVMGVSMMTLTDFMEDGSETPLADADYTTDGLNRVTGDAVESWKLTGNAAGRLRVYYASASYLNDVQIDFAIVVRILEDICAARQVNTRNNSSGLITNDASAADYERAGPGEGEAERSVWSKHNVLIRNK